MHEYEEISNIENYIQRNKDHFNTFIKRCLSNCQDLLSIIDLEKNVSHLISVYNLTYLKEVIDMIHESQKKFEEIERMKEENKKRQYLKLQEKIIQKKDS